MLLLGAILHCGELHKISLELVQMMYLLVTNPFQVARKCKDSGT
jgi:hypothetical protein